MEYRDRFLSEMDANAVFRELFHHDIISDGDQKCIAKEDSPRQQNTFLHACLVKTCTDEALMRACGIIIAVQGNPRMATLGKDMQWSLESGVCVCVCVPVLVCVSTCASTSPLKHCSHPL